MNWSSETHKATSSYSSLAILDYRKLALSLTENLEISPGWRLVDIFSAGEMLLYLPGKDSSIDSCAYMPWITDSSKTLR